MSSSGMPGEVVRVAVVGGGIIGLSSALRAVESVPEVQVSILAERLSPNTTGDGAAGFWNPYLLGEVPPEVLRAWCKETFDYLLRIWTSPEAASCGVGLLSCYAATESEEEDPPYSDLLFGYRDLTPPEIAMFPSRYRYGKYFTTFYAECRKLLPHMMKRFQERGGIIVETKVHSLKELIGKYEVVINCPGVGARAVVPDPSVHPIRGQTIRVYAPWIKHAMIAGDFHVLPNSDEVVCGGTHQKDCWSTNVNPADREAIWKGCCELVPSLKGAKIIKEWVGLRPGRSRPRLERETLMDNDGKSLEVIHNYGHGGSGVTLFWGCAKDATRLLQEIVSEFRQRRLISKM